jgi:Ca-activated chloride channel family protein
MKLSTRFDYAKVPFDKDNEVVLLTGLKAPAADKDNRQPLNLCAVLDISGSMAGDKIERMKRTTQILIDHLTEQDRLGIVIFSTNYTKLASASAMTTERKDELKARVAKLHATNATNISGALLLGFETLGVKENAINRVLLLTDGLPNNGETTIDGLSSLVSTGPKGISVSTIGFGTDHDPALMQAMAQAGGGNYYFIENADQINSAFAQELGGLITCFAQNIKIEVDFKPCVKDVEVLNKAWEWTYEDDKLIVRLPDLFAEESKGILTKVTLEKRDQAFPRDTTIGDVKVTFKNLVDKMDEAVADKAKIAFVKPGDESKERDKEIAKQQARLEAAEAQKQAVQMANSGNYQGAQQVMANAVMALNSCGLQPIAEEVEQWTSSLNRQDYSRSVGYSGIRRAASMRRGRSAGAVYGATAKCCATQAQNDMLNSFTEADSGTGAPGVDTTGSSSTGDAGGGTGTGNIIVPGQEASKKDKKKKKKSKKYNPMTDAS